MTGRHPRPLHPGPIGGETSEAMATDATTIIATKPNTMVEFLFIAGRGKTSPDCISNRRRISRYFILIRRTPTPSTRRGEGSPLIETQDNLLRPLADKARK